MKTSEATNEIAAALAKAQGVIENPEKKAENPAFKNGGKVSKYADLATGLTTVRAALSANGIAVIQAPRIEGEVLMLDTRLAHSSGQWLESEWPISKLGVTQQQIGSATTYARRYSLFSMIGIAGEDDDGNEASKSETPAPARIELINAEEADLIQGALDQLGPDVEKGFLKHMKVGFVSAIPASQFSYAQEVLAKKLKALHPTAEVAE